LCLLQFKKEQKGFIPTIIDKIIFHDKNDDQGRSAKIAPKIVVRNTQASRSRFSHSISFYHIAQKRKNFTFNHQQDLSKQYLQNHPTATES
jgi:hypothetical protein